ncbi:MAG: hypothetical protein F4Y87_09030, partial [Synechococcus sp. SB0665_bin_28]|nr:hypothetical protein [Synechococcus sp. SB0665_bin_28]
MRRVLTHDLQPTRLQIPGPATGQGFPFPCGSARCWEACREAVVAALVGSRCGGHGCGLVDRRL